MFGASKGVAIDMDIVNLKPLVVYNWQRSGQPRLTRDQTIREVLMADDELRRRGLDPAPTFRAKRLDETYVRTWTLGCHFPWLNPR
jgi:hypothetical protein